MPGDNREWYDLPDLITEAWKAMLIALPFLFRRVRAFVYKLFTSKKMKQLESDVQDIKAALAVISDQFRPNGGNSFIDMLTGLKSDVKDLKHDTEQLKQGVQFLNARMERTEHNMNVITIDIDVDGMLLNENHLARELFGKNHEELKGYEYLNSIHPDDRQFLLNQINDAVDLKIKLDLEVRVVRNDVSQRVRVSGNPVFNGSSPSMYFCTIKKL